MSHKSVTEICVHCGQVKGNNEQYCPAITLDEPYSFFTSELQVENKKLNDFSQGLVAINLSLTDQVSQLRERTKELEELNLRFYMDMQSTGMNCNALNMELKELRAKTSTTMGVGSGYGKLFVHDDYESIKAAQAIVLENEKLRKELEALRLECIAAYGQEQLNSEEHEFFTKVVETLNLECEGWQQDVEGWDGSDDERTSAEKAAGAIADLKRSVESEQRKAGERTNAVFSASAKALNLSAKVEKLNLTVEDLTTQRVELLSELREAKNQLEGAKIIESVSHYEAWGAVVVALANIDSNWSGKGGSYIESAVACIKDLAEDAKKFRRMRHVATATGDEINFLEFPIEDETGKVYFLPDQPK